VGHPTNVRNTHPPLQLSVNGMSQSKKSSLHPKTIDKAIPLRSKPFNF